MAKVRDYSPLSAFGPLTADSVLYLVRDNGDGTFSNVALKVDELRLWALAIHKAETPPHTPAEIGADAEGTAAQAIIDHEAEADPHSQYATDADLAAVQSIIDEMKNGLKWQERNADFTAAVDAESIVRYRVDTTAAAVVCTLPDTFEDGQAIMFTDQADTWDTNNFQMEIPGTATYTLEGAVDIGGGVFRATAAKAGAILHVIYDESSDHVMVNQLNLFDGLPWGTFDDNGTGLPNTPPSATGTAAIAMGDGASAANTDAIAVGSSASAVSVNSVSIGESALCSSSNGAAIGRGTSAGSNGVAVGSLAKASSGGTAIGAGSDALGNGAFAGAGGTADADCTVAIGSQADTHANLESIAIGCLSNAYGRANVAIGYNCSAYGNQSTVLGENSYTSHANGTAIGRSAQTAHVGGTSLGSSSYSAFGGTGIGYDALAVNYAVALGSSADTTGFSHSVAVGQGAKTRWVGHAAINTVDHSSLSTKRKHQSGISTFKVNTSDSTPTAASLAVPTDSALKARIYVVGWDNSGAQAFGQEFECLVKNTGGVVTLVGSTSTTAISDFSSAASSIGISGTDFQVTVTGESATNVAWTIRVDTTEVYNS